MYGMDHGAWMFGGWIVMLTVWLFPFVVLFFAIKLVLDRHRVPGGKAALDLLEEAYASGRITREEFLQKREDLRRI
jgi:putative membrane protein